ncbi:FG-GAP-like repeat-containing protein [Streptomyces sp. NPDC012769]|uniref:FG-GAP-like repeat-containing protein n=1 Tax=Streptomyces sp. NPDC012769 TaxID=3364848 RepID=UPI0036AAB8EB
MTRTRHGLVSRGAAATAVTVALATAVAVVGPSTSAAAAVPPAPPVVRVMPLGDSITAGEGSTTGAGYRAPLWQSLAGQSHYTADFVGSGSFGAAGDPDNEGHGGWTIDGIRGEIDRWQDAARPGVVLLHLGINDLKWHGADPVDAAHRLLALVDRIQTNRPGTTVIVLGLLTDTPGQEERTSAFNTVLSEREPVLRAAGRPFRYVAPPRLDVATELPDRLHPNDAGYRKIADAYHQAFTAAFDAGWMRQPAAPRAGNESGGTGAVRWADFDGDGRTDRLSIADNGAVRARLNTGAAADGTPTWRDIGQVATGLTTDRTRVRLADFDGDGRADYVLIAPGGGVTVYLNQGGDTSGPNGWRNLGQVAWGTTNRHEQVRFADHDGDGRADYWTIADDGAVNVHLNRGGDPAGARGWVDIGRIATGTTTDRTRVRLADCDGDGRADYWAIAPDGSVTTYLNRGGDGHGGWRYLGRTATGVTTDHTRVHLADLDADTHADYLHTTADGTTHPYLYNGGDPSGPNGWTAVGPIPAGSAS